MSSGSARRFAALEGVRIGCVRYLNSRPLIDPLLVECAGGDETGVNVHLAHPSELAAMLRKQMLDVALVPVFELLRVPELYQAVRGISISSTGPVFSVYVAHRGGNALERIRAVLADPASLTSVHLFQVLALGKLGRTIPILEKSSDADVMPAELGRLLIGNQAIDHRLSTTLADEQFWDLGAEWHAWTGLPFVYALWVVRRGVCNAERIAEGLREVAKEGVARISEIASRQREYGSELAYRYLSEHIKFRLGEPEILGVERFSAELESHGFVPAGRTPISFV